MDNQHQKRIEDLLLVQELSTDYRYDDRLVAIICCAHLEDTLEEALAARLPCLDQTLREKIFAAGRGIAGALVPKIDLAEAIGVIGPNAATDLRTIAKIRNAFAHKLRVTSFEANEVRDLTMNLKRIDGKDKPVPIPEDGVASQHVLPNWPDKSLRGRFVYSALVLTLGIFNISINPSWGLRAN